ncbi:MAG: diaminopimelate decarboxylase [Planctomycetaceae bacterium]|nr:diaminopimelate decarboxylase [Planctomycetaceae bacterium]
MILQTPIFHHCRTDFGGVSLVHLAEQFGTPVFVYDAAVIRQRVRELKRFDVVRYAQKACSTIAVLQIMRSEGALVDTVSANELHRAMTAGYAVAGATPDAPTPIVYTADIFDRDSLATVLENNVHVNCGSPDMIRQYGEAVKKPQFAGNRREITLRINPGFGHGHSQKTNTGGPQSKHGIWHEQLDESVVLAGQFGLTVAGLHIHIGSGTDLEHLALCCDKMERFAAQVGPSVVSISTGGGLPVPYNSEQSYADLDEYFSRWDAARKRLEERFGHRVTLETEPGRYLTAESGLLLAEIRAVKRQGENLFYLLDAGFTNLARPIMYGAYHPIAVVHRRAKVDVPEQEVVVGGPLCESGDIFTQEEGGFVARRKLPVAEVGDFLALETAGAYGSVMGSNYNSKPHAAEVLIDRGEVRLIRRRQSFEHLTANEIPLDT